MRLRDLFDVFSRREKQAEAVKPVAPLTPEFRNRVLMRCMELFDEYRSSHEHNEFWEEVHEKLRYLVGRVRLVQDRYVNNTYQDATGFLATCTDSQFLDFIDFIFKLKSYYWSEKARQDENALVSDINDLFELDDLPYALTPFVRETKQEPSYGGQMRDVSVIASFPKVIRRDDQVPYKWAVEPALTLLRDKQLTSANKEFLDALEDYRKGDYGDCLVKCGSAFESTMKLICDRKGWSYSQTDTARPLLQVIFQNSQLEQNHFEQALMNIATLRNKLSNAHGAGTQQRNIPQHLAKYAINATAAAILLLVEECT